MQQTFLERFREFDVTQGVVKLAQPKVNADPAITQRKAELVECLKKYLTSSDPPILTLNYISKMFKDDKKIHIRDFIKQSVKVFLKGESATFTVIEGGNNRAAVTLAELARDKPDMVTEFMKRITGPVRDDTDDKGDGSDEIENTNAPWDEQQRHAFDRLCTCDISRNFDVRNVGKKILKIGVQDGHRFVQILMEKALEKPARAHLFAALCSYLTKAFPSVSRGLILRLFAKFCDSGIQSQLARSCVAKLQASFGDQQRRRRWTMVRAVHVHQSTVQEELPQSDDCVQNSCTFDLCRGTSQATSLSCAISAV